eukprot:CAMPEP_0175310480 /NCGR_PEP_ID=MMETSP0093-20121207/66349_1 /TAXON_ID=311494 /ORGANISM="Alexandrium monilatum, Strain CCMP3105" /LENGTH=47 /DNA_ID= /DNA_START= /DNA_END= /DNA_ORIENTATION=
MPLTTFSGSAQWFASTTRTGASNEGDVDAGAAEVEAGARAAGGRSGA